MRRDSGRILAVAGFLLALATLIGAFGAHVLHARLAADRLSTFEVGVRYQFFHSLGLLCIGLAAREMDCALLRWAALCIVTGIVLFCGSLYLLSFDAPRAFGIVTPLGGLALITGWVLFALAAWRTARN
jgi:uncharacterized membrane protein YgdD (TMEM256/DUF423 family)